MLRPSLLECKYRDVMCKVVHNVSLQKFQTDKSLLFPKHTCVSLTLFFISIAKSAPTPWLPIKGSTMGWLERNKMVQCRCIWPEGKKGGLSPGQLDSAVCNMYQGKASQVGTETNDKFPVICQAYSHCNDEIWQGGCLISAYGKGKKVFREV